MKKDKEDEEKLHALQREYIAKAEEYFRKAPPEVIKKWPFLDCFTLSHCAWRAGAIIAVLDITPGDRVLDFGCGNGWLCLWLNRCGVRVIGVDVSPTALDTARELLELDRFAGESAEAEFIVYDGKTLPLADASIDRITAVDAFHHVADWDGAFKELFRVLREGGRLGIVDVGEKHASSPPAQFEMRNFGILERDVRLEELLNSASKAGFSKCSILPITHPTAVIFDERLRSIFLAGKDNIFPLAPFRDSLKASSFLVLEKGEEILDSRHPRLLKHEIRILNASEKVRERAFIEIELEVSNSGDTLWLCEEKYSRHIKPSARLYSGDGKLIKLDYWEGTFERDVPAGGSIKVKCSLPPLSKGYFRLEFDLKWRDYWFEFFGNQPAVLLLHVE